MAGNEPIIDAQLSRRLIRALQAGPEELFQLVLDPATEVLRNLLKNPHLTEEHLLSLLKRRDLSEDLLKTIYLRNKASISHRMQLALARNPATPTPVALGLMPNLYLFELLDLCKLSSATPDQRIAAERQIILRLPNVERGNKLALARRATGTILAELVREGDVLVLQACLVNPQLKEVSLIQLLRSGKATPENISLIARHPRWQNRPHLRMAILKHPRTPNIWYTLWGPQLKPGELKELAGSTRIGRQQRQELIQIMKKRGLK